MNIKEIGKDSFKKEVLDEKELVIVDFNANWCGPCRMMKPILEDISTEKKDIKIVSVNVDEEEELAREYQVFSIPCLVFIRDGKEIKRSVGFTSKEELEKMIGE